MRDYGFRLNGVEVVADHSGALWCSKHRLLAVADLHLEKASAYAENGILLPPYDSQATLTRLEATIAERRPEHVLALGDSFHDAGGDSRLEASVAARLCELVASVSRWTWLVGNHDPAPSDQFGGEVRAEIRDHSLHFRHEPTYGTRALGEVAGHLHPKARVSTRARSIAARCFVTDGRRIVLPAFGALAGGLDVRQPPIRSLFLGKHLILALGPKRVHPMAVA